MLRTSTYRLRVHKKGILRSNTFEAAFNILETAGAGLTPEHSLQQLRGSVTPRSGESLAGAEFLECAICFSHRQCISGGQNNIAVPTLGGGRRDPYLFFAEPVMIESCHRVETDVFFALLLNKNS